MQTFNNNAIGYFWNKIKFIEFSNISHTIQVNVFWVEHLVLKCGWLVDEGRMGVVVTIIHSLEIVCSKMDDMRDMHGCHLIHSTAASRCRLKCHENSLHKVLQKC